MKKIKFLSLIVAFVCLFTAAFAFAGCGKSTKNSIYVSEKFAATSDLKDISTYDITITGKIKNNSNEAIDSIILYVTVKGFNGTTYDKTITRGTVEAGAELSVSETFTTNKAYFEVSRIQYSINGETDKHTLSTSASTTKEFNSLMIIPIAFAGVFVATLVIMFIAIKLSKGNAANKNDPNKSKKNIIVCSYCGFANSPKDGKCKNCGAMLNHKDK